MRTATRINAFRWLCLLIIVAGSARHGLCAEQPASVRVAGIVLKWIRTDKEQNYRRAAIMIREAARHGAKIICTTECFLDGYAIADKSIPVDQYRQLGEAIPGGTYFQKLSSLANELDIHLIAGMLEADGDKRFNTAVVIGPNGRLIGRYRKQRLGHELLRNTAGTTSPLFETEHGRIGLMICADRRFRDVVRRLDQSGAEILICPSGGMFGPQRNDPIVQQRSRETKRHIVFVHPAEFLVTSPDGEIASRTILGDRLLVEPDETGHEPDSKRVFYFDVPVIPNAPPATETHEAAAVAEALNDGLRLIASSARRYTEERSCYSCHHQTLPAMTMALARARGFDVDRSTLREQSTFTVDYFSERLDEVVKGKGVPGGPYSAGYALTGLHEDDFPANETTDALVTYLLGTQADDGRWRIRTHRAPLEDSDFTATALSLRGIRLYGNDASQTRVETAILKAREWLEQAEPTSNEDRVFQLLGLIWSGARESTARQRAVELAERQRNDGGWSQLPEMNSDAYATGQALLALHRAGEMPTDDPVYQRGVRFLLDNRQADGSWRVETRSRPIQTYFESGFPHGKSQFISISATCWSLMALAESADIR